MMMNNIPLTQQITKFRGEGAQCEGEKGGNEREIGKERAMHVDGSMFARCWKENRMEEKSEEASRS